MSTELEFDFYAPAPVLAPVGKRGIASVFAHRQTKKQQIEQFFAAHLGIRFASPELHAKFGSAFRTRVSDINKDAFSAVIIHNECKWDEAAQAEISMYWSEPQKS